MKKAVIFDMDGVVSDTQQFHAEVESNLLKRFGINMSPHEITEKYSGVSDEKMFREIFEKDNVQIPSLSDLIFDKWNLMGEIAKGRIQEIPGASNLIKELKKNKFKLAIASASTMLFINEVLIELKIQNYFDVLVSAQEVEHGKPAPDIFLLALKRLHVKPEEAIVIEDGRSGMIGAKKAKIKCVGLVKDTKQDYPADMLVADLDQITIQRIHLL